MFAQARSLTTIATTQHFNFLPTFTIFRFFTSPHFVFMNEISCFVVARSYLFIFLACYKFLRFAFVRQTKIRWVHAYYDEWRHNTLLLKRKLTHIHSHIFMHIHMYINIYRCICYFITIVFGNSKQL